MRPLSVIQTLDDAPRGTPPLCDRTRSEPASTATAPLPAARAFGSRRAEWLEFLLVGGGTLVLLPLAWLARTALGLEASELAVGFLTFHAAFVLNDPHFAVTYLLFYRGARRRAFGTELAPLQRLRYWLAGAAVPAALGSWAAVAIARDSRAALGSLLQLMFLLVGWHYVKQAFGVLAVLSARRGVRIGPLERRALLVHCYAAWAYAFASPADPGTPVLVNGVLHDSLAHPPWMAHVAQLAFWLSVAAAIAALAVARRRQRQLPPLMPLSAMLLSVWTWTVFSRLDPVFYYLIPALHSLQYLYFVALLSHGRGRELAGSFDLEGRARRHWLALGLTSIGLGWLLLRGLPAFLDRTFMLGPAEDPAEMAFVGPTPFLAAFVAFVNVHHYFMDWVLWRRDMPESRYLLGTRGTPTPEARGVQAATGSVAAGAEPVAEGERARNCSATMKAAQVETTDM